MTTAECDVAAAALGWTDTSSSVNGGTYYTKGCYQQYHGGAWHTYVGTAGTSPCNSGQQCACLGYIPLNTAAAETAAADQAVADQTAAEKPAADQATTKSVRIHYEIVTSADQNNQLLEEKMKTLDEKPTLVEVVATEANVDKGSIEMEKPKSIEKKKRN